MGCMQAGGGVVQCAFGRCSRPLHPLCGRHAGHLLALREADGSPLAFCGLHSGERFAKTRAQVRRQPLPSRRCQASMPSTQSLELSLGFYIFVFRVYPGFRLWGLKP